MRIITIRHDKSQNNILLEQSYQLYLEKRSNDPVLTGSLSNPRHFGIAAAGGR